MLVAVILKLLYTHRNKSSHQRREAELAQAAMENRLDDIEAEQELTDRANPSFVYVY